MGGLRVYTVFLAIFMGADYARAFYIDEEEGLISDAHLPVITPVPDADDVIITEGDIQVDINRNARDGDYEWPNGTVPYVIHSNFPEESIAVIRAAMQEIEDDVNEPGGDKCIQFVERTTQHPYILVQPSDEHCSSKIGYNGDAEMQTVSLTSSCSIKKGTIMHELLHALGFYHEHTGPVRDEYVTIYLDNVRSGHTHNYNIHSSARTLGQQYDYSSIMHYHAYEFAEDKNKPTMVPKDTHKGEVTIKMGQRFVLSEIDVLKIQILYGCKQNKNHIRNLDRVTTDFCNFEDGLCNWSLASETSFFDWVTHNGSTVSGPKGDTTMGTGHYLLATASGHYGQTARLVSRELTDDNICVDLRFYNYHEAAGILKLRVKTNKDTQFHSVKYYRGQHSQHWYHLKKEITKAPHVTSYRLAIEAMMGPNDIAVDDVYIHPGQC